MISPYKRFLRCLFFACIMFCLTQIQAKEITIFNSSGEAVAYLDTPDLTIYLWQGEPIAYLSNNKIYTFKGSHIGWIEKGVLWDQDGNAIVMPPVKSSER